MNTIKEILRKMQPRIFRKKNIRRNSRIQWLFEGMREVNSPKVWGLPGSSNRERV